MQLRGATLLRNVRECPCGVVAAADARSLSRNDIWRSAYIVTSSQALSVLLTGIVGCVLLAAVYTLGAWYIGQRRGVPALLPLWLIIAIAITAIGVFRLHRQYSAFGNVPAWTTDLKLFVGGLVLALASLGSATLSVRKRLQGHPTGQLSSGIVLRGVGAFFAGLALALAPILVVDIVRLYRQ